MKTEYLGLQLNSPIIVSSSPFTSTIEQIGRCAEAGAGAVVLKSIFEEQIIHHAASLSAQSDSMYGDADHYLSRYLGEEYKAGFLRLVHDTHERYALPVIASINCVGTSDEWINYAEHMAEAGAAALEINIFIQPTEVLTRSHDIEAHYADVVDHVVRAVGIPVSVKLPMRLTTVFSMADALRARGAKGVVFFNRFFEPDVDIERMQFVESSPYSEPSELRNVLRTAAICSTALPHLDFSVSTGVHDGAAAIKAILCGARAAQVCTAIHRHGFGIITEMNRFIDEWAARHGFDSLEQFRGLLGYHGDHAVMYQRVQYMKYFPEKE